MDGSTVPPPTDEQVQISKAEFEAMKEELTKLKDKDMNFSKFRNSMAQEKDGVVKQTEAIEHMASKLKEMEDSLSARHQQFVEAQVTQVREARLRELAGDDQSLKDKIMFHYDRLKDDAMTADAVGKKLNDAYILATGDLPSANPIYSVAPSTGSFAPVKQGKMNYSDTDSGKALLKSWFPQYSNLFDKK